MLKIITKCPSFNCLPNCFLCSFYVALNTIYYQYCCKNIIFTVVTPHQGQIHSFRTFCLQEIKIFIAGDCLSLHHLGPPIDIPGSAPALPSEAILAV